ncbi:hypothetical protein MCOR25_005092 [Pyricularia grisea]|nr:hypothetical protein MCOR25_005092 [Pyricularia grisea]
MATEVTASAPGDTTTTTAPHQSSSPRSPLFADDNDDNRDAALQNHVARAASRSSPVQSPVSAPPYWSPSQSNPPRFFGDHGGSGRSAPPHNDSTESVAPTNAITMHDNETAGEDATPERVSGRDRNRACWAKSVSVTDYVIVNSSTTNIGAFVVWNIRVETLSVRNNIVVNSKIGAYADQTTGLPGLVHEYKKALLRVRRPQAQANDDLSKLRGCCTGLAAQERHCKV